MNKKIILATSFILMLSFMAFPVFAAGTLAPHASVEGRAMVRDGRSWDCDKEAVVTFIQYTPGEGSPEGHEAGWAILLSANGKTYVWHVTTLKACGRSNIVLMRADPHPLEGAVEGPAPIRIVLNHNPDNAFVLLTGRGVHFVGRMVVV